MIFQHAAAIDPSNFAAEQEANRTQHEIETGGNPKPTALKNESAISRLAASAGGPAELKPISNTPITLRMTEDAKVVYTTIGKLAGINVLFDPDYTSRRISIELNNVSLDQALEIVALESKTFYRAVTENTIFVAADTPGKRKELEQSVVKTFYLSNVSQFQRPAGFRKRRSPDHEYQQHYSNTVSKRDRRSWHAGSGGISGAHSL